MALQRISAVLQHIQRIVRPSVDEASDGQLLAEYARSRKSETFAQLIQRHGSMVFGACRRILNNDHDAEDAFQATFLILARKADSITWSDDIGNWLYGVACRTSWNARVSAARRERREHEVSTMTHEAIGGPAGAENWQRLLDEEIHRLPAKYRCAVVACYLKGKTNAEAARQLRCPTGTVKARLLRARNLLRGRLERRGLAPSLAALGAFLEQQAATAAPPEALLRITAMAAEQYAAGAAAAAGSTATAATGLVSTRVGELVQQSLQGMMLAKLKALAAILLLLGLLGAGLGLTVQHLMAEPKDRVASARAEPVTSSAAPSLPPAAAVEPVRTDPQGDPLPAGALFRMGTVRLRHARFAGSIVFSPDGKTLASGGDDTMIRLWDVATGQEIRTLPGHQKSIASVAFAPDGKTLASASGDSTISLWDVATGQALRTLTAPGERMTSVAFAPDGNTLASCGFAYWLWEVGTGKQIRTWRAPQPAQITSVAFSSDGKTLAAGSADKTIRLWEAATGQEIRTLAGHTAYVRSVAFAPDGKVLASRSGDHSIRLWNAETGQPMRTLTTNNAREEEVSSLAFSPDGKTLATGWRLWDVASGRQIRTLLGHKSRLSSVAFSPDGKCVATASWDSTIRLWDAATGKEIHTWDGHQGSVESVAYAPDGQVLASGSSDATIRLCAAATGKHLRTLTGQSRVCSAVFSPDGKTLASGGQDAIQLWDIATGKETRRLKQGAVLSVAFSPDGKSLVSTSENDDEGIALWEVGTGKQVRTFAGSSVAFSPDGKTLAVGTAKKIVLWDQATGKEVRTLTVQHKWDGPLVFSPDGTLLAKSDANTIWLWDVATGNEVRKLMHSEPGEALAFSPDGKVLASGSRDTTIRLWEVYTGHAIRTLSGHRSWVSALAFSPDGKTLVSGSHDTTVLAWGIFGGTANAEHLTAKDLQAFWTDLAGADVARAYRGIDALAAAPRASLAYLQQQLPTPVPAPEPQRLARLIADLHDNRFRVRQQATEELEKLGELAEPALRKALDGKPALETRTRLEGLLANVTAVTPERLRWVRVIQVLDLVGGPESKPLLQALAADAPARRVRQEATAALERLARRSDGKP